MNTIKEIWNGLSNRGKILASSLIIIFVLIIISNL
jgi:hypothetical protein